MEVSSSSEKLGSREPRRVGEFRKSDSAFSRRGIQKKRKQNIKKQKKKTTPPSKTGG